MTITMKDVFVKSKDQAGYGSSERPNKKRKVTGFGRISNHEEMSKPRIRKQINGSLRSEVGNPGYGERKKNSSVLGDSELDDDSGSLLSNDSAGQSRSESSESEMDIHIDSNTTPIDKTMNRQASPDAHAMSDSEDDNLRQPTGMLATESRIKAKPKTDSKSDHHIEHTEISNGKVVDAKSSFATIEVAPWLIASLAAMEIRRPTAIQKSCIPAILNGRDVIGGSKTGSGKTITFAVPIIQKWAEDPMGIYALILTPTRELALQIYEQFIAISARQSMKAILVTGGTEMRSQAIALASRPHVVIATPGRLADHINTSGEDTITGLRRTKIVVLDEADRLLTPGPGSMLTDVEVCLGSLPPPSARQTCLFTATLTSEVMALKEIPRSGRSPIHVCEIDSETDLAIPATLKQTYLQVPPIMKEAYLHVLLSTAENAAKKSIILFCNRTKTADLLERLLRRLEHSVTSLHSKLSQPDRNSNLSRFRARGSRILIASDVASRGLDIPEVDMVVNYDIPRNPNDYIHRVGRTARAGRKGESVSMIGKRDIDLLLAIENRVGQQMKEYQEEGVNVQTRVENALKLVGETKREVMVGIEEGRDVKGNRIRGKIRRLE